MKNKDLYKELFFAGTLLVGISIGWTATHYVDLNGSDPIPPYTNWIAAATVIQEAVDVAMAGDEIVVTNGIYISGGRAVGTNQLVNRVAVDKPLLLRSVNGPEFTVIRGYQMPFLTNGDHAVRCVYLASGVRLIGFTLTNGATHSEGLAAEMGGGGVWCESATAVVSNCVLVGNSALFGGGASGGTLDNCTLSHNSAASDYWYRNGYGGGAARSTLNHCVVNGNSAGAGGGAGGGTVNACLLTDNTAIWGGGAYGGQDEIGSCTLGNCTLTRNSAQHGGGTYSWVDAAPGDWFCTLSNCIVYFNEAPDGENYFGGSLSYCCTTPLPLGNEVHTLRTGNITADPQLASRSHLSAHSPCLGAGSSLYPLGTDIDGEDWAIAPSIGCDEYHAGAVIGPLTAAIDASFTNVAAGFAASFTAEIAGRTTQSVWDFGDEGFATNQPYTKHAWTVPGDYSVVLRAYNEAQLSGISATALVHVITAPVHYVAAASTNSVAPYVSWATAATRIQDAVDAFENAVVPGSQVLVSDGIYNSGGRAIAGGPTNRVAIDKPLALRSVNGPQFTLIRGHRPLGATNGSQAIRCVYLASGATLDGFTVTNGATFDQPGAGVWCESSAAVVSNCILVGNSGSDYGQSDEAYGGGAYYGTLNGCTIISNAAGWGGAAAWSKISNCTLSANVAADGGGGIFGCTVARCVLSGNSTSGYGGGAYEGNLINCMLFGNSAFFGGGAYGGSLNNCTIVGNSAGWGGGTFAGFVDNCIVYYNTDPYHGNYDSGDQGNLNYCCTTPQLTSGFGNITNAPLLVDLAAGNPRLQSDSPCINAGNNSSAASGPDLDGNSRIAGGTVDIGAFEFQQPTSAISYAWLLEYGLPTDGSMDFEDLDGDGMSNWQEWRCGTDPTNALSALRLLGASATSTNVMVSWQSVVGVNYFLERTTNLRSSPLLFTPVATAISGQPGTTSYTDTNPAGPGAFFYRVGVGD